MSGTNRPFKYGANDRREFIVTEEEVAIRQQVDGSGNAIYIGRAKPGTSESDTKWQISFNSYSGTSLTSRTWPQNSFGNPSSEYEFSWSSRAGYTYG